MVDLFLFRNALRDLLRARRLPLYLLLIAVPALVALALRLARGREFDPAVTYNVISASLVFSFLLVILAVVFGTGVVSREMEQKTIVYLLTRPIPRWRVLLMRFLAAAVAITLTVWLATGLLALATWQPGGKTAALLSANAIRNSKPLAERLRDGTDPLAQYLASKLDANTQEELNAYDSDGNPTQDLRDALARYLTDHLAGTRFLTFLRMMNVKMSPATRQLAESDDPDKRAQAGLQVLTEGYPGVFSPTAKPHLTGDDLVNARAFVDRLRAQQDDLSVAVMRQMPPRARRLFDAWDARGMPSQHLVERIVGNLNRVIRTDRDLYSADRFAGVKLENQTREMLARKPSGDSLALLNRWLIEEAWPGDIASSRTAGSQLGRDLLVLPLGALGYGALFMLLATLMNRALIVGLILSFGWETWVPLLPGNFRLVSLMTYLRVLAPHPQPPAATVDISEVLTALSPSTIDSGPALVVLLAVVGVCLLLSILLFSLREYVPRDDAG